MKKHTLIKTAVAAFSAAALLLIGYKLGQSNQSMDMNTDASMSKGNASVDPKTGRKVLYWHDPMVPGQRFDKPGKSPFMDMPLVPVYADEQASSGVRVSPGVQQNLGPISLSTPFEDTEIPLDSLSDFARATVEGTISASSLADARRIVADISELAGGGS